MSFNIDEGHYVLCTINEQRLTTKHNTLKFPDIVDKE